MNKYEFYTLSDYMGRLSADIFENSEEKLSKTKLESQVKKTLVSKFGVSLPYIYRILERDPENYFILELEGESILLRGTYSSTRGRIVQP